MAKVYNEGPHAAEFILDEANGNRSRDNLSIGDNQDVKVGSILSAATLEGPFTVGTGGPVLALALYPCVTTTGDNAAISGITRDCTVNGHCLTWPDGADEAAMQVIADKLAEAHVIVRGYPTIGSPGAMAAGGGSPSPASP